MGVVNSGRHIAKAVSRETSIILAAAVALVVFGEAPAMAAKVEGGTLSSSLSAEGQPVLRSVTRQSVTGETFRTGSNETLEILFSDSTSLVLGPGSEVKIGNYRFDGSDGVFDLTIERGLLRISGGRLNETQPITISSPHASMVLSAGTAFVAVDGDGTRAHLMNGEKLSFTSGGVTEALERPEFEVSSNDRNQAPNGPTRMAEGAVIGRCLCPQSRLVVGHSAGRWR